MLAKLIKKGLSFLVLINYPHVPANLKYFYRDTYYCQLIQWKYIFRDYIYKKKYKTITYNGEFAPELQFVLPFAYWHYKNGSLKATISSTNTKELYFFSPEHQEKYPTRTNTGNYNFEMPRILYSQNYNMQKWEQVPLKQKYHNNIYVYEKPILIIANRYNSEWDGPPISFLSLPILSYIITNLKDKYTIIYNRPRPQDITLDESDIFDLNEFAWLKIEHPEVILMEDLWKNDPGHANNYNHLQLMVYANAQNFISTHGGTATLASYFGGTNLIFSRQGPEHHFNCYHTLYPKLSGAKIIHAKTEDELKQHILAFRSSAAITA